MTINDAISYLSYDRETGIFTWVESPGGNIKSGQIAGWSDAKGYVRITFNGKHYFAHRLAWLIESGGELPSEIDHVNTNRSDNRFVNLRAATRSGNQRNKGMRKDNKSGVKGVCWDKHRNLWMAHCQVNGKKEFIGRFAELNDAERAVKSFRGLHHGDFCNHGDK